VTYGEFYIVSNLPIAKCRENYIINTNYFSKTGTNFFGEVAWRNNPFAWLYNADLMKKEFV
jgi:hypothetical protein